MKKICFVVTAEFAVKVFLLNHIRGLSEFYDITVIVNTNNPNFLAELDINAKVIPLAIDRDINLISDFVSLIKLIRIFHQQRFSAIQSITPKAGLLAMLAASLLGVPLRVHAFTGQVWATKKGLKRFFLKQLDCLIASLTTYNIVDSPSQRQFLIDEKVVSCSKSIVFAKGSVSGVDAARFKPNSEAKIAIKRQLNIPTDAIIFLFLGRLTRDKGVLDLANGFNSINTDGAHLLFVGPDEQNMQVEIEHITESCSGYVHFIGHTDVPESYMAATDVLCLPSYREGFGTVVIEAAAAGIPAIASRIYGLTDAVVEGKTGLLHEPHNVNAIKNCMEQMMSNKVMRLKFGEQARVRAVKEFDSKVITQEWLNFYHKNIH